MSIKESNTKKNYSNSYKKAGNIKVADASSYKRDIGVLVNKVRKKYNMKKNKGTFVVQDKGDGIKIVIKKSD